ncbi:MAG: hypothetical protein ABSH28_11215, partial [Acidobacteriota bacterium]
MQKKNQQFVTMLSQTLRQSIAIFIPVGASENICQSPVKIGDTPVIRGISKLIAVDYQFKGFPHQTPEAPGKELPLPGVIAQRNLLDLAQQVDDTLLLGERLDPVIGAEEVGDQDSIEEFAQNLFD